MEQVYDLKVPATGKSAYLRHQNHCMIFCERANVKETIVCGCREIWHTWVLIQTTSDFTGTNLVSPFPASHVDGRYWVA